MSEKIYGLVRLPDKATKDAEVWMPSSSFEDLTLPPGDYIVLDEPLSRATVAETSPHAREKLSEALEAAFPAPPGLTRLIPNWNRNNNISRYTVLNRPLYGKHELGRKHCDVTTNRGIRDLEGLLPDLTGEVLVPVDPMAIYRTDAYRASLLSAALVEVQLPRCVGSCPITERWSRFRRNPEKREQRNARVAAAADLKRKAYEAKAQRDLEQVRKRASAQGLQGLFKRLLEDVIPGLPGRYGVPATLFDAPLYLANRWTLFNWIVATHAKIHGKRAIRELPEYARLMATEPAYDGELKQHLGDHAPVFAWLKREREAFAKRRKPRRAKNKVAELVTPGE